MSPDAILFFMGVCILVPMLLPFFIGVQIIQYIPIEPEASDAFELYNNKVRSLTDHQIDEAIKCLTSMGMKKAEATNRITELTEKKNYKTLEELFLDIYKR